MKDNFGNLRLPAAALERLKRLKIAFESSYGHTMTNGEFIDKCIASVEEGDPAVWEEFCRIELKGTMK